MNVLAFVSAILLILSFTFYACREKQSAVWKIHHSFASRESVSRALLKDYEEKHYDSIRKKRAPDPSKSEKKPAGAPKKKVQKKEPPNPEKINPECARLDLRPLIENGKSADPLLYETLAELMRLFYKKPLLSLLEEGSKSEYKFLDAWLCGLEGQVAENPKAPIFLEKVSFQDRAFRGIYYHMLRGGKENYPSLLDFVKVSPMHGKKEAACAKHATPLMLSIFFGKAAEAVYEELHTTQSALTDEAMIDLVRRNGGPSCPVELFTMINLKQPNHNQSTMTLLQQDKKTDIAIRQKTQSLKKT